MTPRTNNNNGVMGILENHQTAEPTFGSVWLVLPPYSISLSLDGLLILTTAIPLRCQLLVGHRPFVAGSDKAKLRR